MEKTISLGFAEINLNMENQAVVNQEWQWSFKYTAKEEHPKNSKIKIVVPPYQHQRSEEYLQTYNFWKPNYIYVDCEDGIGADIEVQQIESAFEPIRNWEDSNRIGMITLNNGLKIDEEIEVVFGGIDRPWLKGEGCPSHIGQFAPYYPETRLEYKFFQSMNGIDFEEYKVFDDVILKPEKAVNIKLFTKVNAKICETVKIDYLFTDRFNNPIFNKKLDYKIKIRNLTTDVTTYLELGVREFTLISEGYYLIDIDCTDYIVNKAVIRCIDDEENIYWGDLHNHSNLSSNIRDLDFYSSPDNCYSYARNVSHLDYIALTEQTHKINNEKDVNVDKETWKTMGEKADQYNEEDRFITYTGVELHSKRGDTVVMFKNSLSEYAYPENEVSEIDQLWNIYDDILSIPHFHVYANGRKIRKTTSDYLEYNKKYWKDNSEKERLVEVFSSQWGRFENLQHPMILKSRNNIRGNSMTCHLEQGRKWGITAGSDMHDGRPGYGGLTAVYSNKLSRDAIFCGLYNRRTYATTGPRLYMKFDIRNNNFIVDVIAPVKISRIELVGDGKIIDEIVVEDYFQQLVAAKNTDCNYYYLRVRMEDKNMAWSEIIYV